MAATLPQAKIEGDESLAAAQKAQIAVLAVPYAAQLDTARRIAPALAGKILIDVTVPLMPPKVSVVQLPPEGSCVVRVQRELGDTVRVVSAFQNVSAHKLSDPAYTIARAHRTDAFEADQFEPGCSTQCRGHQAMPVIARPASGIL